MNEDKFSGKAELYAKFRPTYPESLITWLYCKTKAETVADIGAGTGIFTRCLLKKPWKITAVEPNCDMLYQLREKLCGTNAEIICASAENTELPSAALDLVTVAQAFHWFDEGRFKAECIRVLKPDGHLAIIFNERCKTGLSQERDAVCQKYCGCFHSGHVGKRDSVEGDRFLRNEYFSSVDYFCTDNDTYVNEEHFIGDTLSRSYALKETDKGYSQFVTELRNIFNKYSRDGYATVKYKTSCYLGTF